MHDTYKNGMKQIICKHSLWPEGVSSLPVACTGPMHPEGRRLGNPVAAAIIFFLYSPILYHRSHCSRSTFSHVATCATSTQNIIVN